MGLYLRSQLSNSSVHSRWHPLLLVKPQLASFQDDAEVMRHAIIVRRVRIEGDFCAFPTTADQAGRLAGR
ncbi:MAG: hypothetical protein H6822_27975 [Planctomycetaceae bacterium]|nr:hypothetical protein [Planctomycetales bacterium]MCB9926020.1 hypothetical protein [Planctomycetaceae bacterium]